MASSRPSMPKPCDMTDAEIRAELRHDLDVYDRLLDPVSRAAMGARITALTLEMDDRHEEMFKNFEGTPSPDPGAR